MQSREGQFHLRLDAGDPRDLEVGRLPGAVLQEGGLSDTGLAANDPDRAVAAANFFQEEVEHLTLAASAQQNLRTPCAHDSDQAPSSGSREVANARQDDVRQLACTPGDADPNKGTGPQAVILAPRPCVGQWCSNW
ncbi:hypothetical protein GCM10009789_35050 [Kribbella sancticallisti]|uniref:Uncharacterized protein n=1 Tax=Kribbella sancticallisti TaxID=460087 RepID=A0ABP4PDA4_9ACTN